MALGTGDSPGDSVFRVCSGAGGDRGDVWVRPVTSTFSRLQNGEAEHLYHARNAGREGLGVLAELLEVR